MSLEQYMSGICFIIVGIGYSLLNRLCLCILLCTVIIISSSWLVAQIVAPYSSQKFLYASGLCYVPDVRKIFFGIIFPVVRSIRTFVNFLLAQAPDVRRFPAVRTFLWHRTSVKLRSSVRSPLLSSGRSSGLSGLPLIFPWPRR